MPLSPACLLSPSRVALPQQSPSLITHWVKERPSFLGVGRGRASRFMLVCWRGDIHELAYFLGCFQSVCAFPRRSRAWGHFPGKVRGVWVVRDILPCTFCFGLTCFAFNFFFLVFSSCNLFFVLQLFFLVFDPHVLSHAEVGHGVTSREK